MKRQLLTLFVFIFMAGNAFAQATAHPAPNLHECNYEVFNLTIQDNVILGNQDPDNFVITYFLSLANATANSQPIATPTAFVPNGQLQVIYARIENISDGSYDVTSFTVSWESFNVEDIAPVFVCQSYSVPPLAAGQHYFTGPNATGREIFPGDVITVSTMLYVYWETAGGCVAQTSFSITIDVLPSFTNVTVCDYYTLPLLPAGFAYYTAPGGVGQLIPNTVITTTQVIYVQGASANGCSLYDSFTVTVFPGLGLPTHGGAEGCDNFVLPVLPLGAYYTGPGGTGTVVPAGTTITHSQMLYIYYDNGFCISQGEYRVVIINDDEDIALNDLSVCDDDGDGQTVFNLTDVEFQIHQIVPNSYISYYFSEGDAAEMSNAIINPAVYMSSTTTVYVGISVGSCHVVRPLNLVVRACTGNILGGIVHYNAEGNGCHTNDPGFANVEVSYTAGNTVYTTFTDAQGNYFFDDVPTDVSTLYIGNINTSNYSVSPNAYDLTVPYTGEGRGFCISPAASAFDVAVNVWPATNAVPGFTAGYYINFYNAGNNVVSGTVTLQYDPVKLAYIMSSVAGVASGNIITYNYSNLMPGQQRYIYANFTVAQPPVANSGDVLTLTAAINPLAGDANQANNTYALSQLVTNSYDPNDITVDKGEFITLAQAGEYLQYTIRFENLGTAIATNVRVATTLDANLDWDTFQLVGASHTYVANREGANVEFRFDDIDLGFGADFQPESRGSLSYRIKPKANIAVGDIMDATAGIYFDFNEAIITNTATTIVRATAGIKDVTTNGFMLYPNPAKGIVNLQMDNNATGTTHVVITDVLGKAILTTTVTGTQDALNIANLKTGMYFVTLKVDGKNATQKLIVK